MQNVQSDRQVDVLHMSSSAHPMPSNRFARPAWVGRAITAFVAALLLVGAFRLVTVDCWPRFQLRADVLTGIVITLILFIVLAWAAMSDDDRHRTAAVVGSAGAAALFAQGWPLVSLLALAGALRLPRASRMRRVALVLAVATVFVAYGLPLAMQRFVQPADFICY